MESKKGKKKRETDAKAQRRDYDLRTKKRTASKIIDDDEDEDIKAIYAAGDAYYIPEFEDTPTSPRVKKTIRDFRKNNYRPSPSIAKKMCKMTGIASPKDLDYDAAVDVNRDFMRNFEENMLVYEKEAEESEEMPEEFVDMYCFTDTKKSRTTSRKTQSKIDLKKAKPHPMKHKQHTCSKGSLTSSKRKRKSVRKERNVRKKIAPHGEDTSAMKNEINCVSNKTPPPTPAISTPLEGTPAKYSFLSSLSESTPLELCDPEAVEYKLNFSAKRDELCTRLFNLYNSEVFGNALPADLLIVWSSKMRRAAGLCFNKMISNGSSQTRYSKIQLATHIVDRPERLRDTLAHELCHAATYLIDGIKDGHGSVWLSWADRVSERFPELQPLRRCNKYAISHKYTYRCKDCTYFFKRHRNTIDLNRKRCGPCGGIIELFVNKEIDGQIKEVLFKERKTRIKAFSGL